MTLKIAHIGDTHLDTRHKRWPTLQRSLRTMDEQMREARPDLIVHAGDLGEKNPNAQDLYHIATFLQGLADIAPTLVVLGNHDARAHWDVLGRLDTRCRLRMVTSPESIRLMTDGTIWGFDESTVDEIGATRLIAHCMPWPAKGQLLANYPEAMAPEDSDRIALECLRSIFRGWRQEREISGAEKAEVPSILVGHLNLSGARGDQGQPLCTPDVSVSVYDLAEAGTDITMLGHIHAQQYHELVEPGILAWYSGSPCRLSWGEAGAAAKGWILHTITDELVHDIVEIPSPRLWACEAEWTCEPETHPTDPDSFIDVWQFDYIDKPETHAPPFLSNEVGPDDELRFRYHVPEEQREAVKQAVENELGLIWPGPRENVTVEPRIIPSTHARCADIATEEDPVAQAVRYLELERPDLSEAQREDLLPLMRKAVQEVTP